MSVFKIKTPKGYVRLVGGFEFVHGIGDAKAGFGYN